MFNNAGITKSGFLEDYSEKDISSVVQTNVLGSIYPWHAILSQLKLRSRDHPISIVFVGSLASLVRCRNHSHFDNVAQDCIASHVREIG